MSHRDGKNNNGHKDGSGLWAYVKRSIKPIDRSDRYPEHSHDVDFAQEMEDGGVILTHDSDNKSIEEQAAKEKVTPQPQKSRPSLNTQNELDRRTEQRFKRGQMVIEGKLDLHGFNKEEAHNAVLSFIKASYAQKKRCVLVVTGKGSGQSLPGGLRREPGVLKRQLPHWLKEKAVSFIVLRHHEAQPKDGGGGAYYVLLRRHRS